MADQIVNIAGIIYVLIRSSDVIEADGSTGKKFWQGHVVRSPNQQYHTCTSSWKDTKGGKTSKVVWSAPYWAEPKNVGRANETTNEQQAHSEFESMVEQQRRKREATRPMPMLAKTFSERKHKLVYPVVVQPKLDGKRMVSDGTVGWSRGNKEQLAAAVQHIFPFETDGLVVDGELLLDWRAPVQTVMSAAHKYQPGLSEKLIYVIYDVVSDLPYSERRKLLCQIAHNADNPAIRFIHQEEARTEEEVLAIHAKYTEQGFEGSIIRDPHSPYAEGKRVDALLKHKDFVDEEFEIVDVIEAGGGSSEGVGKFVCRARNGETFESTATGTIAERRDFLVHKEKYVGKFAKVKYRELTPYGLPFHSNVLEVRESKEGF